MTAGRLGRRLDRIAAAAIPVPAPVRYDFSCYTLEEQFERDTLLATARARPDGGTDPSVSTDDESEALAHLARLGVAAPAGRGRRSVPAKPPGMRWATFERLARELADAEHAALVLWAADGDAMLARLDRRYGPIG